MGTNHSAWNMIDEKDWIKSNKGNKEVLNGILKGYENRVNFIGMDKEKLVNFTKQIINLKQIPQTTRNQITGFFEAHESKIDELKVVETCASQNYINFTFEDMRW